MTAGFRDDSVGAMRHSYWNSSCCVARFQRSIRLIADLLLLASCLGDASSPLSLMLGMAWALGVRQ
jgi:hypothetical protein